MSNTTSRTRPISSRCAAALDEYAGARRRGEGGHDGDRCRDDERAGAGNDEEHERPITPLCERPPAEQRRNDRDEESEHHHRGGVDPREGLDEPLARCARRLRLLDAPQHPGQRRLVGRARHPHLESARPVDRSREHAVAGRARHRPRFAGERRLVELARPRDHDAVERDPLPRLHEDVLAGQDGRRGNPLLAAVAADERGLRGQRKQPADGAPGALEGSRLQQLREREQDHRRRALAPLADHHRAQDGDGHEHVHVQRALAGAEPARAGDGRAADENGREVQGNRSPGSGKGDARARHREGEGGDGARGPWRRGCRRTLRPRAKPDIGEGVLHRAAVVGVDDGGLARHRRRAHRADAGQPREALLDHRDLGRAAHALDLEGVDLLVLAAGTGRGRSAHCSPRLAARGIRTAALARPSSAACDIPMSTRVRMCSSCKR